MEHSEFPSNRVVIVGLLDPQRRRNQVIAASTRRTLQGGRVTEFNLQVDSPFGEPFAVGVTTGVQTAGMELLDDAHSGQPLAIEGVLQTRINLDPRYAISDDDPGRSSRALSLRATCIREPRNDEPCGATAVWLEGAIGAEPRFGVHRSAAAVELVRTIVRVRWRRPSGYPGSQAVLVEEADVNVSVPLELERAAYMLVPGNRVRLVGQLDSVLVPIQGRVVSERLERLATDWRERKAQIEDEATRRRELRSYRRASQLLSQTALLSVVIGAVEPLEDAQPGDVSAARDSDRRRRERNRTGAATQRLSAILGETTAIAEHSGSDDSGDGTEQSTLIATTPQRPRRRVAAGNGIATEE